MPINPKPESSAGCDFFIIKKTNPYLVHKEGAMRKFSAKVLLLLSMIVGVQLMTGCSPANTPQQPVLANTSTAAVSTFEPTLSTTSTPLPSPSPTPIPSPTPTEVLVGTNICQADHAQESMVFTYSLTFNQGEQAIDVSLHITGMLPPKIVLSTINLYSSTLFAPEKLQVSGADGKPLQYTYDGQYLNGVYAGLYEIDNPSAQEVHVNYATRSGGGERIDHFVFNNYIDSQKAALLGEQVFLVPIDAPNTCARVVTEKNQAIFAPWPHHLDGYDPGYDLVGDFRNLAETSFVMGNYARYQEEVDGKQVSAVIDGDIPDAGRREIARRFFILYRYYVNLWKSVEPLPYQANFYAPPDDEDDIYTGEWDNSQGWTLDREGESISNDLIFGHWVPWREYGHQIFHTWDADSWGGGFLTPSWFEGVNDFYKFKASFATGLINEQDTQDQYQREFINKYEAIRNSNSDYPLADINETSDFTHVYKKSALLTAYLSKQLFERTNGAHTLDELFPRLYEKYKGGGTCDNECLLSELNQLTGQDFQDIFKAYIYGSEPIPYDWTFQDDDGDGLTNINEIFMNTDLHQKDSDHDGIDDRKGYETIVNQIRSTVP